MTIALARNASGSHRAAAAESALSAPAMPCTIPAPCETFGNKDFAERATIALHSAKLAPIAVLVAAAAIDKLKRPGIDQFQKPICRAIAEGEFGVAFVLIGFRRIDVFEPDLESAIVDRVASTTHCMRFPRLHSVNWPSPRVGNRVTIGTMSSPSPSLTQMPARIPNRTTRRIVASLDPRCRFGRSEEENPCRQPARNQRAGG